MKQILLALFFFDDDFRPAPDWIASAVCTFEQQADVVGLTGHVLADGVRGLGLSESAARQYLSGALEPEPHWSNVDAERDSVSAYGCNMAFRDQVITKCRFDERLPLYAWQEDRDYTGQVLKFGRVIFAPQCKGVHLGVKSARTNGVRFGYSQIANPIYLARKGTMERLHMLRFVMRAIASNHHGAILRRSHPGDFPGRLKGNYRALLDLVKHDCRPENVLEL